MAVALAAACSMSVANASVTYMIGNGGLESFSGVIDGTGISALAGGILITETAGGDATTPSSYITVCTDIGASLYLGQTYTYNAPATPFAGQSGINPKWGTGINDGSAAAAIQNAAYLFNNYGQLTSAGLGGSTEQKAALQLAIWSVLYNTVGVGQNEITGTRFTFTSPDATAVTDANNLISALNALPNAGNFGYTSALLYPNPADGSQNPSPRDGKAPQELLIASVPEASTVIAGALLLLPFGAGTFKILRKKHGI